MVIVDDRELITTRRGLKLWFQPSDRFIGPTVAAQGEWEEEVAHAIETHLRPEWTFLDLGAHVGYFSLLAAQRCQRVIAVEANPEAEALLRENAAENGIVNIESHAVGVGDWSGWANLALEDEYASNPGAAYLEKSPSGRIPVVHLSDILGDRRPEMIKIDIEGLEGVVLRDSQRILEAATVIIFEVSPAQCARYGMTVTGTIDLLEKAGFAVAYANGRPLDKALLEMRPRQYCNLMAVKPTALTATVILCAWRNLLAETAECMLQLRDRGWAYMIKRGDALITRSRSIAVSSWYLNTKDDVFLMIDDDVVFLPDDADKVVQLAREKRSIVCGAYPVKDGGHLACRRFPGQEITFGPTAEPVEIVYPATGFMACHRDVIDAMIAAQRPDGGPHFPICGEGTATPMWPFFDTFPITGPDGKSEYLSEDYAFGEVARQLGFKIWLDPSVILYHMGFYPYTVENMKNVVNKCAGCGCDLDRNMLGVHAVDCEVSR